MMLSGDTILKPDGKNENMAAHRQPAACRQRNTRLAANCSREEGLATIQYGHSVVQRYLKPLDVLAVENSDNTTTGKG
jgi:hypothetical protein